VLHRSLVAVLPFALLLAPPTLPPGTIVPSASVGASDSEAGSSHGHLPHAGAQ
jgi:hypothetical protein